ncbi:unnamed protein product [Macrosiphum euphorbiae]|uniref:PHD-type domain-containing protein n=1 Tax=Macrosiphum euphorbiae TaxID=13131 RepID=A0AAV0VM13_9HEMI|nr:unnamed protein product [Macrosiphum euphorbiae]
MLCYNRYVIVEGRYKWWRQGVIWGYLLKDIKTEITRGSRVTYVYLNKKGATLSCSEVNCPKRFHLSCGLKNGCMR